MARPVYSQGFITAQYPNPGVVYLVTPSCTAILTHMTLYVGVQGDYGAPAPAALVALDYDNAVVWEVLQSGLPRGTYQWEGREVFYNYLKFTGATPYSSFRANGYLLTPT